MNSINAEKNMKITDNCVVTLQYVVKTSDGDVIDDSSEQTPLCFLQGSNFMLAAIESALYDKQKGDELTLALSPAEAYGERADALIQAVPAEMFAGMDIDVGMSFRATTDEGEQSVIIIDIDDTSVTVDGNHPLAGLDLVFDLKVIDVRVASAAEISSGEIQNLQENPQVH